MILGMSNKTSRRIYYRKLIVFMTQYSLYQQKLRKIPLEKFNQLNSKIKIEENPCLAPPVYVKCCYICYDDIICGIYEFMYVECLSAGICSTRIASKTGSLRELIEFR